MPLLGVYNTGRLSTASIQNALVNLDKSRDRGPAAGVEGSADGSELKCINDSFQFSESRGKPISNLSGKERK